MREDMWSISVRPRSVADLLRMSENTLIRYVAHLLQPRRMAEIVDAVYAAAAGERVEREKDVEALRTRFWVATFIETQCISVTRLGYVTNADPRSIRHWLAGTEPMKAADVAAIVDYLKSPLACMIFNTGRQYRVDREAFIVEEKAYEFRERAVREGLRRFNEKWTDTVKTRQYPCAVAKHRKDEWHQRTEPAERLRYEQRYEQTAQP